MPSLPNISPELIQAYQDQISKSSSSATVKRKSIALNRFFDWAEEAGHIPQNPLQQVQSLQPEIQRVSKSKRKIEASSRTYAVIGLTVALIILLFLLTWKLKFPISFIQNFAQVNNTGEVQNVAQNVSPIPATPAANLAWNLYAKLKLTDSNGIPEVGSQSLSFNLYNSETGGSPVYTSSTQIVTTDTNGSALISIDNVPSDLFFQNNTLYLEPNFNNQGTSTARIPISTANTAANLEGYFPANPETGANSEEIPVSC